MLSVVKSYLAFFVFSKQLVSLLLVECDAGSKDHNLFYVAVEIKIQKKGIAEIFIPSFSRYKHNHPCLLSINTSAK